MNIQKVIQSQYLSALAMLKQVIVKCPRAMWDAPQDKDKFWFKAYHALYYAHLYLQATRKDFVHWRKHSNPVSCAFRRKRSVIPADGDHPFRSMTITESGAWRSRWPEAG